MRRRLLSLILCVACLVPICRPVPARAVAVVDDAALLAAGGVALVGSLLIAGGAKFTASEDVQRVAQDIYDKYIVPSAELTAEVTRICTDWRYAKSLGKRAVINVSARLWEAICSGPVKTEVEAGRYGMMYSETWSGVTEDNLGRFPWAAGDFSTHSGGYGPNILTINGHTYRLATELHPSAPGRCDIVIYMDGSELKRGANFSSPSSPWGYSHFVTFANSGGHDVIFSECNGLFSLYFDFPVSFTWSYAGDAVEISYPTDSDLIRPGDKSTTVQLPSDLPGYAEDGTTVEMPVISLDQSDYIITDGDVISSSAAAEDVILDAATGERVEAGTDVDDPSKPIEGTGVLSWLQSVLKGLLDKIVDLLTAIRDGIVSIPDLIAKAIAAIFVPSDAAVSELQGVVNDRLPIIPDVKQIVDDCGNLLSHPEQAASGLGLTTIVDFSKRSGWGDSKINLLDASWFVKYKSFTDDIIVGIAWLVFLWNLYAVLPGIIHGASSGHSAGAQMPSLSLDGRKELPPL